MFHLMEHRGQGGASTFVDGFRVAEEVRKRDRDAYEMLCNTPVVSQYLDPVRNWRGEGKVKGK